MTTDQPWSMDSADILAPDGSIEARICVDCKEPKPIEQYQRTPKAGGRSSYCKACMRAKYERGRDAKAIKPGEVTKEWIIGEAQKLYIQSDRNNDKIKLLDLISRNVNEDARSITDDAKLVRDLIASKKKQKEIARG